MSGTKFDSADTSHIAEGRTHDVRTKKSIYDDPHGQPPPYLRFIILEVINDPQVLDHAKLSYYEHVLNVSNIRYAAVAPRNSVIARRVMGQDAGASEKVMVLYPFFPSHLALPCKPGEHVWGMFEHPDAKANDIGYWMCRIAQPSFVDDVNHTHADRQYDQAFLPGLSDVFEGTDQPVYELRNGAVDQKDGQRYSVAGTASHPEDEAIYEKLRTQADGSKQIIYEPVPRYRKRPADTVLEGSNNTLIVLGTDRTGPATDYSDDPNQGKVPKPVAADNGKPGAGTIDLVVGRGQTSATGGTPATTMTIAGQPLGTKELGKSKKDLQAKEGDIDLINDRSRLMISQRTSPDTNFKIDTIVKAHTSQGTVQDGSGEGAIVVKTDKVRLIARHDVVILVTGATSTDADGNVQDPGANVDNCASIVVRTNGDIVFTPAKTGLIRLGGDDADLAPLCSRVGTSPGMPGPLVPAAIGPIVDTMGGTQGKADGLNGTFPTKVLFK